MPASPRTRILEKFRGMIAAGRPIVGGGAGTGLSAKAEEAGGIDLLIISNSGRYRMAGRGSAAGLLAYGNANEIVMEMAREVLPVVRHTPVLAVEDGTATIIATPHQLGSFSANGGDAIRRLVAELQQRLDAARIPLKVLPGADVRIEPELVERLTRGTARSGGGR